MLITILDEVDPLFAQVMTTVVRRRGHTAKQVESVEDVRDAFPAEPASIVVGAGIVDDTVINGLRRLRAEEPHAVIILVAEEVTPSSTIAALEAGATNILRKPLMPSELITWLEHSAPVQPESSEGAIKVADLEIDLAEIRAVKAGHVLTLTRMEFRLLYCLAEHFGRVAPTDRLMSFSSDGEEMAASSLKTHISHLRQKLRNAGGTPMRISARQMLGYVLDAEADAELTAAG
ncbi:MAG: response regulator transcription factor [Dehalococcoidia bacterium]|nr:response regulator transcription factor [Dehalococcoidia bacterium]MCB9484103.1 response regulator transcription factor [Dehalococcoidia bacterium]